MRVFLLHFLATAAAALICVGCPKTVTHEPPISNERASTLARGGAVGSADHDRTLPIIDEKMKNVSFTIGKNEAPADFPLALPKSMTIRTATKTVSDDGGFQFLIIGSAAATVETLSTTFLGALKSKDLSVEDFTTEIHGHRTVTLRGTSPLLDANVVLAAASAATTTDIRLTAHMRAGRKP